MDDCPSPGTIKQARCPRPGRLPAPGQNPAAVPGGSLRPPLLLRENGAPEPGSNPARASCLPPGVGIVFFRPGWFFARVQVLEKQGPSSPTSERRCQVVKEADVDSRNNEISDRTEYDKGPLFQSEAEVRRYFTVANLQRSVGPSVLANLPTQAELDRMAQEVLENHWHCAF